MHRTTVPALTALWTVNAAPTPKSPIISLNIRSAEDLAVACSGRPTTPSNAALLNFCNGFAQGVVQSESQNAGGSKICFPKPAPKRNNGGVRGMDECRCGPQDGGRQHEPHSLQVNGTIR
jgi:hypothetical protein